MYEHWIKKIFSMTGENGSPKTKFLNDISTSRTSSSIIYLVDSEK